MQFSVFNIKTDFKGLFLLFQKILPFLSFPFKKALLLSSFLLYRKIHPLRKHLFVFLSRTFDFAFLGFKVINAFYKFMPSDKTCIFIKERSSKMQGTPYSFLKKFTSLIKESNLTNPFKDLLIFAMFSAWICYGIVKTIVVWWR